MPIVITGSLIMESPAPRDGDKKLEEEDVLDPECAFQFSAVLKEMEGVFHRKTEDEGEEDPPRLQSWVQNDVSKLMNNFLTVSPSWSETLAGETPSIPQEKGESVFGDTNFFEDEPIKYEEGCERLLDGNKHHMYDEDGETGYHSMTTTSSSDSSSLDSLSPSPTTAVGNVRALPSSYHFSSDVTIVNCPPLLKLPDKLLVDRLFPLLGPRDLVRLSALCRRLQRLCWSTSLSLSSLKLVS